MTRTALVTGASRGIGLATAELLFAQGWNVVATMRQPRAAREDARWLSAALDVTDAASIEAALAAAEQRFGRIDVLVNNAGYGLAGSFESIDEPRIARQFETNVFGLMRCCRAVLPHFRRQGGGVIVNVASIAGRVCFPFYSIYNASKFAVEGFSEALQFEVEALGVRVKLVEPGVIRTDFYGASADFRHDPAFAEYDASVARATARMRKLGEQGASPERVAHTILQAATDGSLRLRYPVGDDASRLLFVRRWFGDGATYKLLKRRLMQ